MGVFILNSDLFRLQNILVFVGVFVYLLIINLTRAGKIRFLDLFDRISFWFELLPGCELTFEHINELVFLFLSLDTLTVICVLTWYLIVFFGFLVVVSAWFV